jgi:hypothetical protein
VGESGTTDGETTPDITDMEITHDLLILRARYWLENTAGAKVVLTEFAGGAVGGSRRSRRSNREIPDAIGWLRSGVSLLIECKASRGDFLSDAVKPSRRSGKSGVPGSPALTVPKPELKPTRKTEGLGAYRFYLTPSGLLRPDELPEGWGLLELRFSPGTPSTAGAGGSESTGRTGPNDGPRYTVRRIHDPLQVFDPRTGKPRRGLPDTRTRGTLQKENSLALSALRLVQLRDLHGQELSPTRSVHRNLGHSGLR